MIAEYGKTKVLEIGFYNFITILIFRGQGEYPVCDPGRLYGDP
jgi:hypothetical protein